MTHFETYNTFYKLYKCSTFNRYSRYFVIRNERTRINLVHGIIILIRRYLYLNSKHFSEATVRLLLNYILSNRRFSGIFGNFHPLQLNTAIQKSQQTYFGLLFYYSILFRKNFYSEFYLYWKQKPVFNSY